ncbi:hypothetical protein ACSVC9_12755 [Clostridium sp. LBM24168]
MKNDMASDYLGWIHENIDIVEIIPKKNTGAHHNIVDTYTSLFSFSVEFEK